MNALALWSEFKSLLSDRPQELTPVLTSLGLKEQDANIVVSALRKIGLLDILALKSAYEQVKVTDVSGISNLLSKLNIGGLIRASDISTLLSKSVDDSDLSLKQWVEAGAYRTLYEKLVSRSSFNQLDDTTDFVLCDVCHTSYDMGLSSCPECGVPAER